MTFPSARELDPVCHDHVTPCGVINPPAVGPCKRGAVLVEGLPAAHVYDALVCSGTTAAGPAHAPPAGIGVPVVTGSTTVFIHGVPAARWMPSGDVGACHTFLGSNAAGGRSVFFGGVTEDANGSMAIARTLVAAKGHADIADLDVVARQLTKYPPDALRRLAEQHTLMAVCRGSVTDYRTDLKGVRPRGWPPWRAQAGAPVAELNAPDWRLS